jgi:hypothetical protein
MGQDGPMTNRIALSLVALAALLLAADAAVLDLGIPLFLARKGADLVAWVQFWR